MSSTQAYNLTMQVVVHSLEEAVMEEIKAKLLALCPDLSFSPSREQPSLNDCLEVYASARVDEAQKSMLLETLDSDWDEDEDLYWAYGFNTRPFDSRVYYLQLEFTPLKS